MHPFFCQIVRGKMNVLNTPFVSLSSDMLVRMWTFDLRVFNVNMHLLNRNNRMFCIKPNAPEASAAMDSLVKNLQTKLHLSNKMKQSSARIVSDKSPPVKPSQQFSKALSENVECDTIICDLLEKSIPNQIIPVLQKFAIDNKFPSRRTLVRLARICADKGYVEGVNAVRDVGEIAFPIEAFRQMNYRHYEAEAHWKQGNCEEALKIFQELFAKNPYQRRKLANMSTFLMRYILNNHLTEYYPKLVAFVESCLGFSDPVPAANLWRTAFSDETYEANVLAEKLLTKHREAIFSAIAGKVPAILKEAKEFKLVDLMQRLMQFVLKYDMKELQGTVIGTYMDYLCDDNDVTRALETFQFISESSIIIPAESVQKLLALLAQNKKKLPSFIVPNHLLKDSIVKPIPRNYKF